MSDADRLPALPDPAAAQRPLATIAQAARLSAELPELLVSLLERRYLNDLEPATWQLGNGADDGARPLLCEVLSMGRERPTEDWSSAMPHVLTATHAQGHAVVMALHGDGERHRIFLGGRRLPRLARGSTEDFIEGQASVLQAHIPGMRLGSAARLDGDAMSGLSEFLRSAPVLATVTGVPSSRGGASSAVFQNIDRLVSAAAQRRYALVVVAEPLQPADLDHTVDHCRRLRTEVHSLIRRTVSRMVTEGESESSNTPDRGSSRAELVLPGALYGLAMFCGVAGLATGLGPLVQLASPAMLAGSVARQFDQSRRGSTTVGTTRGRSETGSVELLDASAEACDALLRRHIDRLEAARSSGWWRTSVFVAAESEAALESVTGALRGIASGQASALDPVRVVRAAPHLVRTAATRGQSIGLVPASGAVGHPLGAAFDALATCMSSDELSILVTPPRRDVPGLPRHEVGEFALSAPPETEDSIRLGLLQDPVGRLLGPVSLTARALNRHALICGMTGYGKTTTAKRLLVESHCSLGLPFLVIEPVKAEYRRLADHPELRGRLRVYTIGDDGGDPLRLNPFAPVENVPLLRHIDLLKAVFNASFPMFAGMSYVLEEAMLDTYTERGWNLHTSTNDLLGPNPSSDDIRALVPSIADLHDRIEVVLEGRQYGREVHQNLGAALRSRLRSLMVGAKGLTLDTTRSVPARELFGQPVVIELRNLGDDEEKAFVMALILCQLYEFAEARQLEAGRHDGERLQHITLIEEAHRLLRAARAPGGPESPDAQAKAVTMFTDMLAEMRAYGEGFIVADQIPTKLAPEIMKNSNVKILHRLVAPDDRAVVASAVNLTDAQSRHLAGLPPGTAIVHDDRMGSAVLVRLSPLTIEPGSEAATAQPRQADRSYLHRNAACHDCPAPCTLLGPAGRVTPEVELDGQLQPFFRAVLLGDANAAWAVWEAWRTAWLARAGRSGAVEIARSAMYCATAQSGRRWVARVLAARASAVGQPAFEAQRLLTTERCARPLARLCSSWGMVETLDERAREQYGVAQRTLAAHLTERPPTELPGCARCPMRCRMLPVVAPVLPGARKTVAARATAATSPDARLRSLAGIADPAFQSALGALATEQTRRAFLYCAVTTATADLDPGPGDLLALLQQDEAGSS
jgi:DNA helicase HerA-like ATPase